MRDNILGFIGSEWIKIGAERNLARMLSTKDTKLSCYADVMAKGVDLLLPLLSLNK